MTTQLEEFYRFILPDDGFYFVARTNSDGKVRYRTSASIDAHVKHSITAAHDTHVGKITAAYFTPFSFKDDTADASNNYMRRTAENAYKCRCLYADLDIGEGKKYPDKDTALLGLAQFTKRTGFPSPNCIVNSGGGWHLYWVMDEVLGVREWQALANVFKQSCIDNEFGIDAPITADPARILRLPTSFNNKYTPAAQSTIAYIDTAHPISVRSLRTLLNVPEVYNFDAHLLEMNNDLNKQYAHHDSYMADVVTKCNLMKHVASNHGADCDEPMWASTLQVVRFCKDADAWVHPMSDGHPEYNQADTDNKYALRCSNDAGPTTCQFFKGLSLAHHCDGCQHDVSSPIVLGIRQPEPPADPIIQPAFPRKYAIGRDGIYKTVDGEKKRVIYTKVYDLEVTETADELEGSITTLQFNIFVGKERKVIIPAKALTDRRTIFTSVVNQGLHLSPGECEEFKLFMGIWMDELRRAGQVTRSSAQFGWSEDEHGHKHGFVVGTTCYLKNGHTTKSGRPGDPLTGYYMPKGDREIWDQIVALMVRQNQQELMAIIASSFAAPLVPFTGVSGVILAAVSKMSGVGKSSAMKVAQAVWGHPTKAVNSLHDTTNAIVKKMGVLNNLPAYWDEIRMKDDIDNFVKLAFQLGQGKEKSRLNQDASMREVHDWKTMLVCASNMSFLDHLGGHDLNSNAGLLRIMEYNIDEVSLEHVEPIDATFMFSQLDSNYGHAGHAYGKYLIENISQVRNVVKAVSDRVNQRLKFARDERFWGATVISLLSGAVLAKQLKLVDFDIPALQGFLEGVVADMRELYDDSMDELTRTDAIVTEFIRSMANSGLVTDIEAKRGRGRPKAGEKPQAVNVISAPKYGTSITHHILKKDGELRVPASVLNAWLTDNGKSPQQFKRELKDRNMLIGLTWAKMGAGTGFETSGHERCFRISINPVRVISSDSDSSHDHDFSSETAQTDST